MIDDIYRSRMLFGPLKIVQWMKSSDHFCAQFIPAVAFPNFSDKEIALRLH